MDKTQNKTQQRNYQKLFASLSKLYESTMAIGTGAHQQHKVRTFLKMGQLMLQADLQGEGRSTYGQNAMQRIADDMTQRYGSGFKLRNVYYIRDFAGRFSEETLRPKFTWNHYKILMTVEDPSIRSALEAQLESRYMPVKAFQELVRQTIARGSGAAAAESAVKQLVPKQAHPGIYKLTQTPFGAGEYFLDLGFGVEMPLAELLISADSLEGLKNGDFVRAVSKLAPAPRLKASARTILELRKVNCRAEERYCYKGAVKEIIDSATVSVHLSLGFGVYITRALRLRGVDASMKNHTAGPEAATTLLNTIKPGDSVRVLTYHRDRLGRWVADILFGPEKNRVLNHELAGNPDAPIIQIAQ